MCIYRHINIYTYTYAYTYIFINRMCDGFNSATRNLSVHTNSGTKVSTYRPTTHP